MTIESSIKMNNVWDCNKKPEECPYRWDYRGCIKENCPFPYEYEQKEAYLFNLDSNLEEKNECTIESCIDLCKNKLNAWGNINELEIIFKYLSIFRRDNIDKFFIGYLAESEKGNKKIDKIVDDYYKNVF